MSQNFLQTGMTLAFLKLLLSVRPQLKQGLKMRRVHTHTGRSVDTFHAWWKNSPRVVLGRPQNKSGMYGTKNQNNNLKFRIVVVSSMSMA